MVQNSGDHQLRLAFYPIIYKVSKTSQVVQPRRISPQHQTVSCGSLGTLSVAGLRPIGMFGTRLNGRDVHASARYINTKLSPFLGALEMLVGAFDWCLKLQPPSPPKKKAWNKRGFLQWNKKTRNLGNVLFSSWSKLRSKLWSNLKSLRHMMDFKLEKMTVFDSPQEGQFGFRHLFLHCIFLGHIFHHSYPYRIDATCIFTYICH